MNKETIYRQISAFNKDIIESKETKTSKYYYVSNEDGLDIARFITFLCGEHKAINDKLSNLDTIIDLAFGSGSLTTYILLENNLTFNALYFNDKFGDDANSELIDDLRLLYPPESAKIKIKDWDFFDADDFNDILADLLIFNPTSGGQPASKNYRNKKNGLIEDLTATLEKIVDDTTAIIFFGSEGELKELFPQCNRIYDYWKTGKKNDKHLFFACKSEKEDDDFRICYEKNGYEFVEIPNCEKDNTANQNDGDLDFLENKISNLLKELNAAHDDDNPFSTLDATENDAELLEKEPKSLEKPSKEPFILRGSELGNPNFPYKNILLKGVPGTGKSWRLNKIIEDKLGLGKATHDNVLRINVHSASSNADLMQGIGIATKDKNIEYHEKKGLILQHLERAVAYPYEAFVIVLEEIQENSLNELIGDLIYLIEDEKRTDIQAAKRDFGDIFDNFDAFLDRLAPKFFVKVPYLVSTETRYRRLIVPKNLYFFCTSNYRDDKKIVEDNLLRRFDLIEIYPEYAVIEHPEVATFLQALNNSILHHFDKNETHPDRFMIGHAAWMQVNSLEAFCRALLKAITEFKDIREIEFRDTEKILKPLTDLPFGLKPADILRGSYKTIIEALQHRGYKDLF